MLWQKQDRTVKGATEAALVLHIAEAWGGGVVTSAQGMVASSKNAKHVFFVRGRQDVDIPTQLNVQWQSGNLALFLFKAFVFAKLSKPDVVLLHSSFSGLLRVFFFGKSNVYFVPHCFSVERTDLPLFTRKLIWWVESALARTRNPIVVMSPREEELARALGSKKSVRYCNFSDLPQREFTRRDEIKRIGMIGRLSEQKNPGLFAAIVNELQDLNLEWVWIGDGDSKYREQLTNRSIAVSGWLEPNQVILEVEKLDLVLHTASWEGSPVSTLESLRMGKPVVCASIPSMVSLGYFAAGQDARTIANSLRQVILDQQSWGELISKSEKVLSQNRKGLAEEYMKKIING